MKRACSFLLAFLLMVFLFVAPLSVYASQETLKPKAVTGLSITTANEKNLLKLTWDQQSKADGYQIYRSTSGKTGSYKKIATLSSPNMNRFTDSGLKAAKTYYYAVRAFCKTNGKVYFGKFAKTYLSTRLTIRSLQNKLKKANQLNIGWIAHGEEAYNSYDWNDTKPIPGESSEWLKYVRVKSTKYKSVSELKKAASKCFVKSTYTKIIDSVYADFNGKLYRKSYDVGGDGGDEKAALKIVSLTDTSCKIKVVGLNEYGMTSDYRLVYKNGYWLFTALMDDYGLYYCGNSYWK